MTNEPNPQDADDSEHDDSTDPADPERPSESTAAAVAPEEPDDEPADQTESGDPAPASTDDEQEDDEQPTEAEADDADSDDEGDTEEAADDDADRADKDEADDEASSDGDEDADEAQATGDEEETDEADADDEEEEADEEEAAAEDEETNEQEDEPKLTVPDFRDISEQGVEWLDGLFERMNLEADAEVTEREGEPRVDITGGDADRLLGLGKLGPKAIEGIETLMQSVFSEDDSARDVYVDVDGKRKNRKEMLQRVAGEMADRAVELHKSVTVSGLNSTERRIIHRRLRDYDGVDTESVGDGIFRRLRIEPTE